MRGLSKAALLLAPALARAVSLESTDDAIPSAFINLRLPESGHEPFPQDLTFRFDVLESKDACGYANVTINGQTLPKGGSGSLTADQDRAFIASWNFTCVTWNDEPQEQLMSFEVNYVNGNAVKDVGFTIRFQQVAPVWISDIEGSASMTRVHKIGESKSDFAKDEMDRDLDDELAELDFLRMQLAELEQRIFMKEKHLSHVFGWSDKKGIGQCDNLKCVMKAIYRKMSGAAMAFYGDLDFFEGEGPRHHRHNEHPHWKHPHGKPGHGNHTHGNHTFPHPPWHHPPHHRRPGFPHPPPFCRCPPPPPPPSRHHHPEEPPHHGPPGPPPPPPPFDGPDHEFPPEFPPDFDRPDHHRGPWHHEPHEGGWPHHGPPPPPPPFEDRPERPLDFERPDGPPEGPPHEPPQGPPHSPPHGDHPGEDGPPFPPPPPPHHHGGQHPGHGGPPPPHPFRRFPHPLKAIVTVVLLTILVTMLHRRFCLRGTREERRARRQSRREAFLRRRAARKARCKSFFARLCFGRCCADDYDDDEEKTAMMRERSESEDSTTMEQEIAAFRTAADMVGDMVAAEEGRSHQQQHVFQQQPHHHHPGHEVRQIPAELPSPTSAFPDYHSIQDEALPAYEDSNDDNSAMGASVVTDGFRYTPGSSIYTPSSDGDSSVGADDVLRDTKH